MQNRNLQHQLLQQQTLHHQLLQQQRRQQLTAPPPTLPTSQPYLSSKVSSTVGSSSHPSSVPVTNATVLSTNNNLSKTKLSAQKPNLKSTKVQTSCTTKPTKPTSTGPPKRPKKKNPSTPESSIKGYKKTKVTNVKKPVKEKLPYNIYVDSKMVDRSWSELLSRRIPHDHVYSIIHNYVYEHFGTPSITFANRGSNATTRKYECSTCKKWSITLRCRQQVRKVVGVGDGKKSNNNKTWEVD